MTDKPTVAEAEKMLRARLSLDRFYDVFISYNANGAKLAVASVVFGLVMATIGAGALWVASRGPQMVYVPLAFDQHTGYLLPKPPMVPTEFRQYLATNQLRDFIEKLRSIQPVTTAQLANPKFNPNVANLRSALRLADPKVYAQLLERMHLQEPEHPDNPTRRAHEGVAVRVEVLSVVQSGPKTEQAANYEIVWRETELNGSGLPSKSTQFKALASVLFKDPKASEGDYGVVIEAFDFTAQPNLVSKD